MRFRSVRAKEEQAFAVPHVVNVVRLSAETPGVRQSLHRSGVADTRLVVYVVRAPESSQLSVYIALLVVHLCRAQEHH